MEICYFRLIENNMKEVESYFILDIFVVYTDIMSDCRKVPWKPLSSVLLRFEDIEPSLTLLLYINSKSSFLLYSSSISLFFFGLLFMHFTSD